MILGARRGAIRPPAVAVAVSLLFTLGASAQDRPLPNLKEIPPGQRVTDVRYCRGEYDVSLADGSGRKFKEYDLAFKIASSPNGPNPVKPALVPTGRVGDRAVLVFADIAELRGALKTHCRD